MITAIIPARSGSKRLPNKNIKMLANKPLIFHTINSVLNHPEITRILFTTDSKEYINLVKAEYDDKLFYEHRPSEYATDNTKVYDELKRLIKKWSYRNSVVYVVPSTCPLRNNEIVRDFLDCWNAEKKPYLFC